MPTYRKLHTKVIDSYDFAEMPDDFARVVWLLLPLILDSEGRGIYNMAWIRSKMFPLRTDVQTDVLDDAFSWFVEREMIVPYEVNGKKYFYIPTFKLYQTGTEREAKSVLPEPPELSTNSGVGQELVEVAATATVNESVSVNLNSLYAIYEQEVGALTPILADLLDQIEKDYPEGWFALAVVEAKQSTTRVTLKYIDAILKRWKSDGLPYKYNGNGNKKQKAEKPQTITLPGGEVVNP